MNVSKINDLVSIIIPVYNSEDTICQCIESILKQTYLHKEIIVIDDGSTDKTAEKIKKYNNIKIKAITHTGNPASVRNSGIKISTGKYISFIDADDFWNNNALEKMIEKILSEKDSSAVYGDLIYIGGKMNGISVHQARTPHSGKIFDNLLKINFIPMHPCIIKKEIINKIEGFDEDPCLSVSEDYDFWLRISYSGKILYCPDAVGYYRIKESSRFNKTKLSDRNKSTLKVIKKINRIYSIDNASINKKMAVICITIAKNSFAEKNFYDLFIYSIYGAYYLLKYFIKRK